MNNQFLRIDEPKYLNTQPLINFKQKNNFSVEQLCDFCKVGISVYYGFILNGHIKLSFLYRISKATKIPISDFFHPAF